MTYRIYFYLFSGLTLTINLNTKYNVKEQITLQLTINFAHLVSTQNL